MSANTFPLAAIVILSLLPACTSSKRAAPQIDTSKVVDLSYGFGPETIYWPTAEPFKLQRVAYGRTPGGFFYYANNISGAEHGGTHIDAPMSLRICLEFSRTCLLAIHTCLSALSICLRSLRTCLTTLRTCGLRVISLSRGL